MAQVAPTEVNEQAIDEFGLDRKTGRFVWSSGPVIGVGGEGARLEIVVTGIDNPPNAELVYKAGYYKVEINGPRLTISPAAKVFPQFAGEDDADREYVTVDYQRGSHSFTCTLSTNSCVPHYWNGTELHKQSDSYLFIDRQGIHIAFSTISSDRRIVTEFPDGRVVEMKPGRYRRNNNGFLLKEGDGTIRAVNQARNYCDLVVAAGCQSATHNRVASLSTSTENPALVTDASGGTTSLRWVEFTAKETRPPVGDNQDIYASRIRDLDGKYLAGVTFPGSVTEDIKVSWEPVDPRWDTHDDVRVSSITRAGVTADYSILADYPFGKFADAPEGEPYETDPSSPSSGAGVTLTGMSGGGRLWAADAARFCAQNAASDACNSYEDWQAGGGGGYYYVGLSLEVQEAPPDEDRPGSRSSFGTQIYFLTIAATVDGESIGSSYAHRPNRLEGMARRRLLYVTDGEGRKTEYRTNHLEEVAGVIYPEGNAVAEGFDLRGNVIAIAVTPETDPATGEPVGPTLVTTFSYEDDCPAAIRNRCNLPLSKTDPFGNVTEYDYNDRGQLLTETGPAPEPDAARPVTRNEYTERTAYILDGNGGLVAAGQPISLLTRTSQCLTTENCEGTPDEVVTEYDYGPVPGNGVPIYATNLLLRGVAVTAVGADGQMRTLRTCYGYNYFGEKISETSPRADLASCS